jgi:hypothetical protein
MIPDDIAARLHEHKRRLDKQYADIAAKKLRAETPPPDPHACPDCWVERGETNIIIALPTQDDRWGCSSGCGFLLPH